MYTSMGGSCVHLYGGLICTLHLINENYSFLNKKKKKKKKTI
jgi:hypothetical protein